MDSWWELGEGAAHPGEELAVYLSSLRNISRAKGITAIAEEWGLTRKGVQKALSEQGNPKFESIKRSCTSWGIASPRRRQIFTRDNPLRI
jgi:probable addiction module antidote protein